jgi:hypothetical protein
MATNNLYTSASPYYNTDLFGKFLDVLSYRSFPKYADDKIFMINKIYENKPHLLASDLYGNPGLWWVFAERNPNIIQDPVGDFIAGVYIQLPSKQTLTAALGV